MSIGIGERKILAVDWDSRAVRIVHAAVRRGKVRIDRMLSVDVPADVEVTDPVALGQLIRAVLDQQKIRTERVILDVSRDQALLTSLKLPNASADEMPALVEYQITKELPFPLAEAVVDFAAPSEPDEDGRLDVLVGTVRRDVVSFHEQMCRTARLKLERLGLRPYANKVAVNELYGRDRYDCVVMVDVGPRLTEIDVVRRGNLAFSRAGSVSVPRLVEPGSEKMMPDSSVFNVDEEGASPILQFPSERDEKGGSDVDRVVNTLLVEVTRSIEAYRATQPGLEIDMILVGGGVGVEGRLAEAIGRRYSASVELYNPARQFGWPEDRGREGRAFAAALGLVCGHAEEGRLHFDFLHPKKAVTARERRMRKAPAAATAALLFIAAGAAFYFTYIRPQKEAYEVKRKAIRETEKTIEDLEEVQEKIIATAEDFQGARVIWLDELRRLAELMPSSDDMVLTRMDMYQKGGRISVQLEAVSDQVVTETVTRIDNFRPEGRVEPYYDAKSDSLRSTSDRHYDRTGSMEIEILDKKDS